MTERVRQESRALPRERRIAARRRTRAQTEGLEELGVRFKGAAYETRRRLRPVFRPVTAVFSRLAPYITRTLLFVIQLIAGVVLLILELARSVIGWIAPRVSDAAIALALALQRYVTPLRTATFVGVAAAIALGVSQFFDYHGVAVSAPDYAGEIGAIAPVPITGTETAGSAHLWVLLPVAAVALVLLIAAYRGRPRLAGGVAICGLLGIAVALAIDLPQGLDAGRPGLAFSGSEAVLLQGFWAEIVCSAMLIFSAGLIALYSRGVTDEEGRRRRRRSAARRRRVSHQDVGEISGGLQAES
ncbi:MAG: hypothetical protein ACJ78Y_07185 [Myxococcales bacterium]